MVLETDTLVQWFADSVGRGRRTAIDAAPADIKANNDRRKIDERR